MVDTQGITYGEACSILEKDYNSRNRLWASWGAYDRDTLHQQCKRRKVRYPMNDKHINLKRVATDVTGERMSMLAALQRSQIAPEGTQHRGADDAWNSARLLHKLLEEKPTALKRYGI
jgi:inhibitor of KinA sporulation pathway (predicted exonuclease)